MYAIGTEGNTRVETRTKTRTRARDKDKDKGRDKVGAMNEVLYWHGKAIYIYSIGTCSRG